MSDLIYLLITLAIFASLALLVGYLDRRLSAPSDPDDLADGPADLAAEKGGPAVRSGDAR